MKYKNSASFYIEVTFKNVKAKTDNILFDLYKVITAKCFLISVRFTLIP